MVDGLTQWTVGTAQPWLRKIVLTIAIPQTGDGSLEIGRAVED